jgi:serine/tyrosine/threonine adenylyltransferase
MAISGETIDYGPCAFIDSYDPATVFSSIDQFGRYAYANQPHIAQWNLTRLAEALLPLLNEDQDRAVELAQEELNAFPAMFESVFRNGMRAKLGLRGDQEGDIALAKGLLDAMARGQADFTLVFRSLADDVESNGNATRTLFSEPALYDAWSDMWRARLDEDPSAEPAKRAASMRAVSPIYIPRNHQVEAVIQAAVEGGDFGPFEQLVEVLSYPFDVQPGREAYAIPPRPDERVLQTFCGT